jgi:hypothetical protein
MRPAKAGDEELRTMLVDVESRMPTNPSTEPRLRPGTRVEVRRRFDFKWARGFEVVEAQRTGGYRVRRLSDGVEIPVPFEDADVRRERKDNTWWY